MRFIEVQHGFSQVARLLAIFSLTEWEHAEQVVKMVTSRRYSERRRMTEEMEEEEVESLAFSVSSDSRSSDEENENHPQRGRRSTRDFDRQSMRKTLSTVRPTHSTPSSGRKRLESQSVRASTKTKPSTTDIRIAMLNERKQKKMVALFYWRRKTLETYFSAWRWVALSPLRSVKREMRHQEQQLYTYAPHTPSPADPRHVLLRNAQSRTTIEHKIPARRESAYSTVSSPGPVRSNRDERIRSLREEYRRLKEQDVTAQKIECTEEKEEPSTIKSTGSVEHPILDNASISVAESRQAFRLRLSTLYRHFDDWRFVVAKARVDAARKQAVSIAFYENRICKNALRTLHSYEVHRKYKQRKQAHARFVYRSKVVGRIFRIWKRWRTIRLCLRQVYGLQRKRELRRAIVYWDKQTKLKHAVRMFVEHRQLSLCCQSFNALYVYIIQRRVKRASKSVFHDLYKMHLQRRALAAWRMVTFDSPSYVKASRGMSRIGLRRGLRIWQSYMERRRSNQVLMLQAGYLGFRLLLRQYFLIWRQCYLQKQDLKRLYCIAGEHHKRRCLRVCISQLHNRSQARVRDLRFMKSAGEWSNCRLLRKLTAAWREVIRGRHRVSVFQVKQVLRLRRAMFKGWKEVWLRKSRSCGRTSAVTQIHSQHLLRMGLLRWRCAFYTISAFSTLKGLRLRRTMKKFLLEWHRLTYDHKRKESLVARLLKTSARSLKHAVFSQWCGATLRQRCLRRLVKLFNKKRKRKKLRHIFIELWRHARCRQIQRRGARRDVSTILREWSSYASTKQYQHALFDQADHFYSVRRHTEAIALWRDNVTRDIARRRLLHKSLSHLIQKVRRKAFHGWYRELRRRRRRERLVQDQCIKRCQILQWRCLRVWYLVSRDQVEQRMLMRKATWYLIRKRLKAGVKRWHQHHELAVQASRLKMRAFVRRQRSTQRMILRAWRVASAESKSRKQAASRLRAMHRQRLFSVAIERWKMNCFIHRRFHQNRSRAIDFRNEYLILSSFYAWHSAALKAMVLREQERRVRLSLSHRCMCCTLEAWRLYAVGSCMSRRRLHTASNHQRSNLRRKGIAKWATFVDHSRSARKQLASAELFANGTCLSRFFRAWKVYTSSYQSLKQRLRAIFQTGDDCVLRKTFDVWKRYKRSSTLYQSADAFCRNRILRRVWRHWSSHLRFLSKMQKNVQLTSRLLQGNLTKLTFFRWKHFVQEQKNSRILNLRCDEHRQRYQHRSVIHRMRFLVEKRRKAEYFIAYGKRKGLTRIFTSWKTFVMAKRYREKMRMEFVKTRRSRSLTRVFLAWKTFVKQSVAAKITQAVNLRVTLATRRALKAWKQVMISSAESTFRRHKADKHLFERHFRTWHKNALEELKIRNQVNEAVAHVDRVIKVRIWHQWGQFIELKHEKQSRIHRAEAQACKTLQRTSFMTWKTYMIIQAVKQEKHEQAVQFHTTAILYHSFSSWTRYCEHRRHKSVASQERDRAIQRRKLEVSLHKWYRRIREVHNYRENEQDGTQHYRTTRLAAAVDAFRLNQRTKKIYRENRKRATLFWCEHVTTAAFRRWTAFKEWRYRHKRLIRLFRMNHQADYFAIWRDFVHKQKFSRKSKAAALKFFNSHTTRRMLQSWQVFCQYRQAKRAALAFSGKHQLRRSFTAWSHRARVLLRMKKMFALQDCFRLETHFCAWKRFVMTKKRQIERLGVATKFFQINRVKKAWTLWSWWLELRKDEKEVLRMAIGFRRRFFSLKFFTGWRAGIEWTKRERILGAEAVRRRRQSVFVMAFGALAAYYRKKKRLADLRRRFSASVRAARMMKVLNRFRNIAKTHQVFRIKKQKADAFRMNHLTKRIFVRFSVWCRHKRDRHACVVHAESIFMGNCSRRILLAWHDHTQRLSKLRQELRQFRLLYFRSVADDCFYKWKRLIVLKSSLRRIKKKVEKNHKGHACMVWQTYTAAQKKLRIIEQKAVAKRTSRLLRLCLLNWENAATDQWTHRCLVDCNNARATRRLKHTVFKGWKSVLPLRQARKKWRAKATRRYADKLRALLHMWRDLSLIS